ncbi:hypothetical protein PACTADRAFT_76929 [Pachysolen tannophilus NRRL Y-2460]|uniref:Large ribosomal subunit protein uL6 alpha-beta domain-containing protein n=1 Tax=Pachysolen tannophilus NRRL Y-2460 TaxID=669874 RepID=A0A1E4TRC8_PACTA|nr:hypothetical protein PACTADRAFT_76929 [Pachysolen tannophilus NRRL Y-2460]
MTAETSFELNKILIPKIIKKGRSTIKLSQVATIKGPKGALDLIIPDFVKIENLEGKLNVSVPDLDDKIQKSMWGTVRSILQNNIVGVSEGHLTMLRFVGTGYRAQIEKKDDGKNYVMMKVGKCVLQGLPVPEKLIVSAPSTTRIIIEGIDKQQVKLYAANLRKFHPPEPYKGKGIYIDDETITLKDKKIK